MLEATLENEVSHAYPESYFKIQSFEIYTGDYPQFSSVFKSYSIDASEFNT